MIPKETKLPLPVAELETPKAPGGLLAADIKVTGQPLDPGMTGKIIKPRELVDIVELTPLSRNESILYNQLLANAWNDIRTKPVHKVLKASLRGSHDSNDRLEEAFDRLMSAWAKIRAKDPQTGAMTTFRIHLLGTNAEEERDAGYFYYTFPPDLLAVISRDENMEAKPRKRRDGFRSRTVVVRFAPQAVTRQRPPAPKQARKNHGSEVPNRSPFRQPDSLAVVSGLARMTEGGGAVCRGDPAALNQSDACGVSLLGGKASMKSERPTKTAKQKDAEAEVEGFRDDLGPFVVAAETTRMAMVFSDAKAAGNPIIFANDAFLNLTGYAREEVLGQPFNFILAHRADADVLAQVESEFHSDANRSPEVLYRRKDGTEFWAALFINPVLDEAGNVVQHFASFVDLTRHREEEAKSRMLIDELNHRVKNTLATVQSIVWQALRTLTTPRSSEVPSSRGCMRFHGHTTSSHAENWKSAGLHDLIDGALAPFGTSGGRADRIIVSGPNIRFPPPSALAQYCLQRTGHQRREIGALSNETGSVLIEWPVKAAPGGKRLVLHWRESNGPKLVPPVSKGFGTRVIESGLTHELGGRVELDYRAGGLVCT